MKVIDTPSRAALQDNSPEISNEEMNYFVHFMMSSLPISEKSHQKLVTETTKGETLQKTTSNICRMAGILPQIRPMSQTIPPL